MLSSVVVIKDQMEKRTTKTSGIRPNPRNGSLHRHGGHMSSSAAAGGVHGSPRNFNLKQQDDRHHEKSFQRSRSCSGRTSQTEKNTMRRPKTHPELLSRDDHNMKFKMNHPVDQALSATKLLVNVTVAQSSGPLRLLLSKDATSVEDVIKTTLLLYAKEGRRPLLCNDPTLFGLHYSQFSIDCLNPGDKIKDLGFRNFFLCSKTTAIPKWRNSCYSPFIFFWQRDSEYFENSRTVVQQDYAVPSVAVLIVCIYIFQRFAYSRILDVNR